MAANKKTAKKIRKKTKKAGRSIKSTKKKSKSIISKPLKLKTIKPGSLRSEIENQMIRYPILLSVLRKEYYNESLTELMRGLKGKKVCYVTLNKPAFSLEKSFKLQSIDTKNMFFIDAVSKGIGRADPKENVINVSSPAALTELSIAIGEIIKSNAFDALLFDSLSTLNVYELGSRAERFTSSIMTRIKSKSKNGLFTCLTEDTSSSLIRSAFMYVDKVVNLEKFYEILEKNNRRIAYSFTAIFAGLIALSLMNTGDLKINQITGLSILDSINISTGSALIFVPIILFVIVLSFFIYKKMFVKVVPDEVLVNIKPGKANPNSLRKHFKSKIKNWHTKKKK